MKHAVINIDPFLPTTWSADYGDRAFQYDAFICHNHDDDHSRQLARELISRNVKVWHDEDQDLRNRRVQQAVSRALSQSRFVVVCLNAEFNDSEWCRAEYLPAIEIESHATATRVLVAQMTAKVNCPASLTQSKSFRCYQPLELDQLATVVREGNRLPFDADVLNPCVESKLPCGELRSSAENVIEYTKGNDDANSIALCLLAYAVLDGDKPRHGQQLMAARSALIHNANLEGFSSEEYSFLFAGALFVCQLSDSDNRANGLMMAMHLSERGSMAHLRPPVFERLAIEPDWTILVSSFPWFERLWPSLDSQLRELVELCALRDPQRVGYHQTLVREFQEVTRVKVYVRGLETKVLPIDERLNLIEGRIDYVLNSDTVVDGSERFDELRNVMGISDLEIIFRELDSLIFDFEKPRPEASSLAPRIVRLVARVADVSLKNAGAPLSIMAEWVLDYVLIPLVWCSTLPETKAEARKVFNAVCRVMEDHTSLSHEVPKYRKMANAVGHFESKLDLPSILLL